MKSWDYKMKSGYLYFNLPLIMQFEEQAHV